MVLALDVRLWNIKESKELSRFTNELISKLSIDNIDSIVLISDKALQIELLPNKLFRIITIQPSPLNFITYTWWYKMRLPFILKKYGVDLFIGTYGFLSSKCPTKQIMIIHDLSFFHKKQGLKSRGAIYQKRNFHKSLPNASLLLTINEAIKAELEKKFTSIIVPTLVCFSSVEETIQPLTWDEKQQVKNEFSQGAEYFIMDYFDHTFSEFIIVLKSFSIFKKWQKSNMKLVVICNDMPINKDYMNKLSNYKYRNDIILLHNTSEQSHRAVLAAAYAYIHPVRIEGFAYNILRAMKCDIPVIAYDVASAKEMLGDFGFYANPFNETSLSEQLKIIYKNENIRNNAINEGRQKASKYTWEKTRSIIHEAIQQVMQQS